MVEVITERYDFDSVGRIASYCGRDFDAVRLNVRADVGGIIDSIDGENDEFSMYTDSIALKLDCNNLYFTFELTESEFVSDPTIEDLIVSLDEITKESINTRSIRRVTVSIFSAFAAAGVFVFGQEHPELRSDTFLVECALFALMMVAWADSVAVNHYRKKFNSLYSKIFKYKEEVSKHLRSSEEGDEFGIVDDYLDLISQNVELFATSAPTCKRVKEIRRNYHLRLVSLTAGASFLLMYLAVSAELTLPVLDLVLAMEVGTLALYNAVYNLSGGDLEVMLGKLKELKRWSLKAQLVDRPVPDFGEEEVMAAFDAELNLSKPAEQVCIDARDDCKIDSLI